MELLSGGTPAELNIMTRILKDGKAASEELDEKRCRGVERLRSAVEQKDVELHSRN